MPRMIGDVSALSVLSVTLLGALFKTPPPPAALTIGTTNDTGGSVCVIAAGILAITVRAYIRA